MKQLLLNACAAIYFDHGFQQAYLHQPGMEGLYPCYIAFKEAQAGCGELWNWE
jgi:hypothetical protein